MNNELLDKTFADPINQEEFNQYILDFVNYNDLLEKRLSNIFKLSPWLYNFTTKEDLRQDIILTMLESINKKFPKLDKIGKLKYFNACVKNTLGRHIRELQTNVYPVLNDECDSIAVFDDEQHSVELIYDLFLNENLEYQLVKLIDEGYKDKDIMEMLDIGRKKFYKIKNKIREKLRRGGYFD